MATGIEISEVFCAAARTTLWPAVSQYRRAYRNLAYFNEAEKGGHFAAWEQPELFATELRAAFRPVRPAP